MRKIADGLPKWRLPIAGCKVKHRDTERSKQLEDWPIGRMRAARRLATAGRIVKGARVVARCMNPMHVRKVQDDLGRAEVHRCRKQRHKEVGLRALDSDPRHVQHVGHDRLWTADR